MVRFKTPAEYANAVLPFLHPFCHSPNYLYPQLVNESTELFLSSKPEDTIKEGGDTLFYLVVPQYALTSVNDAKNVAPVVIESVDWESRTSDVRRRYGASPERDMLSLACQFGGQWAKTIREPDTRAVRIRRMSELAREMTLTLREIANGHGLSLRDLAEHNHAKIADRHRRGALMGDGDHR